MTIIIGAGASGLLASILIARSGTTVTLLEQNSKVGKKILVSGNGKCNIGNVDITPQRYHSENPLFVEELLQGYSSMEIRKLFDSMGVDIVEGKDGKLFPMSMQASSVVEILLYEAQRVGVTIVCDCAVQSIAKEADSFALQTSQGDRVAKRVILATGSAAAPRLGGNMSGMEMATALGHRLIPSYPSLVQLCSDEEWVKQASGVKVDAAVKLYANSEYISQKRGDILFTNYGISGLAILDISRDVSLQLAQYAYCELSLDIWPEYSKEKLTNFLLSRIDKESDKPLDIWLLGILNKKLIPVLLEQSKSKVTIESQLNRKEISKLVYTIKNLKLSISDTKGFAGAEVATGGVDTLEVDARTMQSKLVNNLYFAGEILDVDGDRGGFNFHFAWVCAMRVARGVAKGVDG